MERVLYEHILIPTDGSGLAKRGVEQGLSLTRTLHSKVTILMATERFPIQGATTSSGWVGSPVDYERYEEGQRQFASSVLSAIKVQADQLGIRADTVHVANEHPSTAILEAATCLQCDLIVMASHNRHGIERLFLGSQTSEVLAHSSLPVLVVR